MANQGHRDRLSAVDASFLHQEKQASHMHVGALVIFEGPPPAREDFAAHIESRLGLVPRYRQKLAFPRFEMGRPFWVDDPSFNLDYHVRHTALPKPGSDDQLRQLAGPHLLPAPRPVEAAVGGVADPGARGRPLRPHLEDPSRAGRRSGRVDIATVLFDLAPVPPPLESGPGWSPHPEPSDADLVAEGIKGLARTPLITRRAGHGRASESRAARSRRRARRPRGSARSSGRG